MIPVYLYKETFAAYALAARRAEMADDFGPYHLLSDNMLEFRSCILCRCRTYARAIKKAPDGCLKFWSRGPDLNRRPPGYEPGELPDCSTPQYVMPCKSKSYITRTVKVLQVLNPLTTCLSLFLHK